MTARNLEQGIWFPEDSDSCYKTGYIDKLGRIKLPYFPACKTHQPIRHTQLFSLEILEKIMMNVF
jgi:hypothetical protein